MTLLDKARSSPPHWANDTIRPFDEELYRDALPFAIRRYWCDSGSVNVFRVVGTRHPDYRNMNWRWMLGNGKRMTENLALHETNPGWDGFPPCFRSRWSGIGRDAGFRRGKDIHPVSGRRPG